MQQISYIAREFHRTNAGPTSVSLSLSRLHRLAYLSRKMNSRGLCFSLFQRVLCSGVISRNHIRIICRHSFAVTQNSEVSGGFWFPFPVLTIDFRWICVDIVGGIVGLVQKARVEVWSLWACVWRHVVIGISACIVLSTSALAVHDIAFWVSAEKDEKVKMYRLYKIINAGAPSSLSRTSGIIRDCHMFLNVKRNIF